MKPKEYLENLKIEVVSTKASSKKICGIYMIYCKDNESAYVGQSRNLYARLRGHRLELSKKIHKNSILQRTYDKYGPDSFVYLLLEICEKEQLLEREKYLFDLLEDDYCMNIMEPGYYPDMTAEACRKSAEVKRGRKVSDDTKEKLRLVLLNMKMPEEAIQKISSTWKKKLEDPFWKETRMKNIRKIAENCKGKPLSEEHREKLRVAISGKKQNRLTMEKIKEIKYLCRDYPELNNRLIAEKAGVKKYMVRDIRSGITWANIVIN
jgi:group I intron endonuclease